MRQIYSSDSIGNYTHCKEHLLFLHTITGCVTTSALFNKGKIKALKLLQKRQDLQRSAEVFNQENCPLNVIVDNGVRFLLAMYGAPIIESCINNYRYLSFAKLTRFNTPVKLSLLPPTATAAQQHLYRVYYEVQTWLGNEIDPEQWGWVINNYLLEPTKILLPPAPDALLNTIFCNCTKGCGSNCGCRKVELPCSAVCGHCRGHSCLNVTPDNNSDDNINIEEAE